jgi:hypothetical protein
MNGGSGLLPGLRSGLGVWSWGLGWMFVFQTRERGFWGVWCKDLMEKTGGSFILLNRIV